MKNRFFTIIAFLGITAFVLTGCSEVPQAEIDAANAAIEQAKTAGAEVYAPELFVALQDSLNGAMVNIESQKSKFIKNYADVKGQLVEVTSFAAEVKQQTETKKEAVKVEIQNTIAEVGTLIKINRELILEAPRGKEGTSALVAIQGELDAVESSILETSTLFESGDYIASLDKSKVAKEKAAAINTELTEVIAKYKGNMKNRKS